MPTYAYRCEKGHVTDHFRSISNRDEPAPCPLCGQVAPRDVVASMEGQASTDQEYATPVYSRGLGVPPNQIREAQQKFPHHNFTPDGRMILTSHNQRKRVLKELGFFDKDGY